MADRTYSIGLKVDADTAGFSKMAGAASAMSSKVSGEVGKIAGSLDKLGAGKIRINFDASKLRSEIAGLKSSMAGLKGFSLELNTSRLAAARTELSRINDMIRQLQSAGGTLSFDSSGIAQITGDLDKLQSTVKELGATRAEVTVESDSERALSDLDRVTDQMRQLDGERVEVLLEARDDARDTIIRVERALHEVDGYRAEAYVTLRDDALSKLDKIESELRAIEGMNVSTTISVRDNATGSIESIRRGADQTRNVLGNMVGNSVQDIAQLGGVSGSAGVAIGQMAEYAADGSIGLRQMAGLVGPMAALGGAVALASKSMADAQQRHQNYADSVDRLYTSLRDGADAIARFRQEIETTGQLEFRFPFAEELKDILPDLARAGLTVEQFGAEVERGAPGLERLAQALRAAGVEGDVAGRIMIAAAGQVSDLADAEERAAIAAQVLGESSSGAAAGMTEAGNAGTFLSTILNSIEPTKQIDVSAPGAVESAVALTNVMGSANGIPPTASTAVSSPGAVESAVALANVTGSANGIPPSKSTSVATPGAVQSAVALTGVTQQANTIPPSKQTAVAAPGADSSAGQLGNVTSQANSIPPSKHVTVGATDNATGVINRIKAALAGVQSKSVSVNVNTNYTSSGGATFTGPGGTTRRATGGKVGANERMTLVGERGPEFVSLPSGSFVHTAPQTRRMASAAAASGMVGMAGGGQVYGTTPSGGSASDPHNWRGISMLLNDRRPGKPPDNLTAVGGGSRGSSSGSSSGGGDVNVNFYGPVSTDSKAELARYLEHRLRAVQLGQMAGSRH